ncbi:Heterokaryon incompatibility protein (HET) domain containing protein [Rhypophila decipiens]
MSSEHSQNNTLPMSPLDRTSRDIRILSLKPGKRTDPIVCTLSTTSLDDNPRYEALSYVWGDPSICEKIILDNQERDVTVNLFAALRRLRYPKKERHLWVDALCINQADNDEKTHQVGLMTFIYPQAKQVLVWLGDYDDETPSVPEQEYWNGTMPYARGHPRYPGNTANHRDVVLGFLFIQLLADQSPGNIECIQDFTRGLGLDELETGLRTILDFSWWTRLWTVQEVYLAGFATVVCGGLRLDWDCMGQAALHVIKNPQYCKPGCACPGMNPAVASRFTNQVYFIFGVHLDNHPAETLNRHRGRFASDPRDYVYAVLGMFPVIEGAYSRAGAQTDEGEIVFRPGEHLNPQAIVGIRADYSLDHRIVYAKTVVIITKSTKCLDMLWRPREYNSDPLLPTWVPDWTASIDTKVLSHVMFLCRQIMVGKCTAHPSPVVNYAPEAGTLTLLGVRVDTVASTHGGLQESHVSAPAQDPIFPAWRNSISGSQPYPRGEGTYEEAFWRVVAKDHIPIQNRESEVTRFLFKGKNLYAVGPPGSRRIESGERRFIKEWHEASPLGKSWFLAKSLDQTFFITKSGMIGLGPFDTRVGDEVYILAGGKCPFLLRRAEKDGEFTLVGAAFVQGLMYNEGDPADWSVAKPVTLI